MLICTNPQRCATGCGQFRPEKFWLQNDKTTEILQNTANYPQRLTVLPAGSRKILILLLAIILSGLLAVAAMRKSAAPDVQFTTLQGQRLSLQQLQGKVVLVNFWATTCPGCIAEMPRLMQTYQHYRDHGFEVIAVAMAYDPPSQVANYARMQKLPFPVALDTQGRLAAAFNDVKLTPTAFIIDKRGRIVRNVVGELDFDSLHAMLDQKLGRPG